MADVSPIDLQKALSGIDYPVDRQALVERARERGAPPAVLEALEALPDREYDAPNDVSKAAFHEG
jgi:Protein of unknown function (DUF2795)